MLDKFDIIRESIASGSMPVNQFGTRMIAAVEAVGLPRVGGGLGIAGIHIYEGGNCLGSVVSYL